MSGKGFIARENINAFFANGTFQCDFINDNSLVDKIEVYRNSQNQAIQIVGIGLDMGGKPIFIHFDEGNAWNYDFYYGSNSNETFDDIELNSQYVLTVGKIQSDTVTRIIVRRYDKNNISTNIAREFRYMFTSLHKFHAKTLYSDYLAIVGTIKNGGTATLGLVIYPNLPNMPIAQQQRFNGFGDGTIDVLDLTYYDIDQHLVILEHTTANGHQLTANDAVIVWDVSGSTPSTVDIYYGLANGNTNLLLNGIVEYAPYQLAVIGVNPLTQATTIWYANRNIHSNNYNCNTPDFSPLTPASPFTYTPAIITPQPTGNINWQSNSVLNYSVPCLIICN